MREAICYVAWSKISAPKRCERDGVRSTPSSYQKASGIGRHRKNGIDNVCRIDVRVNGRKHTRAEERYIPGRSCESCEPSAADQGTTIRRAMKKELPIWID